MQVMHILALLVDLECIAAQKQHRNRDDQHRHGNSAPELALLHASLLNPAQV